jgi:hypothetical protein
MPRALPGEFSLVGHAERGVLVVQEIGPLFLRERARVRVVMPAEAGIRATWDGANPVQCFGRERRGEECSAICKKGVTMKRHRVSGRNSVFAKLSVLALFMSLGILEGCTHSHYVTVRVPPKVDLRSYEAIGVVEFGSNADATINRYATQRFQSLVQSAQPGTRLVELGTAESVLAAIGARQLDADAIKKIGARYGVAAVFQGNIAYSEPSVNIRGITDLAKAEGGARAEMRGDMFAKLVETKTAASVWSNSSWVTKQLGGVRLSDHGIAGTVQTSNPREEMVPELVRLVITGLRESTVQQRVPD